MGYPTDVKTFPTRANGQTITPSFFNDPDDEITGIEQGLLEGCEHWLLSQGIRLSDAPDLTIASGAVTVTMGYNLIDTEGGASTDDLATVTLGAPTNGVSLGEGTVVVLAPKNASHVVTCKDGTGNLSLNGDFVMRNADDRLVLLYDGTNWVEVSRSNLSGVVVSWTPTMTCGTSGTITVNTGSSVCKAIKLGCMVKASGYITVSSVSSPVGRLLIGGLPYAQVSGGRPVGNVHMATTNAFTGIPIILGNEANGFYIDRQNTDGSDPGTDMSAAMKSGSEFYFSISYLTAP